MSVPSIVIFAFLLVLATAALIADLRAPDDEPLEFTTVDSIIWKCFGFFGVGAIPPMLVLAVFASTAAIAGATLDTIAAIHLADHYPAWFPANAAGSGMGIGLVCARLLSASAPPVSQTSPNPGTQDTYMW